MSPLRVNLYTASLYQGQKMVCSGDIADLSVFPVHSLEVPYGIGVTLYSGKNFTGTAQTLAASIPSLTKTRLDKLTALSIKVWSTAKWQVTGQWLIKASNGQFLTIRTIPHFGNILATTTTFTTNNLFKVTGYVSPCASGASEQTVSMSFPAMATLPVFDPTTIKAGGITISKLANVVMVDEGGSRFSMRLGNSWIGLSGVKAIETPTYESRAIFTRYLRIAEHEGSVGSLNSGEAALFENPGYWGKAYIFNGSLDSFAKISGLNDQISSIQFGPHTGATVYTDPGFGGLSVDYINHAPSVDNEQIDNSISSMKVWRVADPLKYRITHTSRLSSDYVPDPARHGEPTEQTIFRTQVGFPPSQNTAFTERVSIWMPLATDVTVNGVERKAVNEQNPVTIDLVNRNVSILVKAASLNTVPIKLHYDRMDADEFLVIFPDKSIYQQFEQLTPDSLAEASHNGTPLFKNETAARQVASALNIAASVVNKSSRDEGNPPPQSSPAGVRAAKMGVRPSKTGNESVQTSPFYRASVTSNGATAAKQAVITLTPRPVKASAATERQYAARWSLIEIIDTIGDEAEKITKPIIKEITTGLETATEVLIEETSTFVNDLAVSVKDISGQVKTFVLTTVDDITSFCGVLLEAVECAFNTFVDWIKTQINNLLDLFNWGDILELKDQIEGYLVDAIKTSKTVVLNNRPRIKTEFTDFQRSIEAKINECIESLGGSTTVAQRSSQSTNFKFDKLDWIFDKLQSLSSLTDLNDVIQIPTMGSGAALLTDTFTAGAASVTGLAGQIAALFSDVDQFIHHPELLAADLLKIVGQLLSATVSAVASAVDGFLNLLGELLDFILACLQKEINIPGVSALYEMIADEKLTLLSLTSLMIAIPAKPFMGKVNVAGTTARSSVIPTAVRGVPPPPNGDGAGNNPARPDSPPVAPPSKPSYDPKAMKITKQVLQIAASVVDGSLGIVLDTIDQSESSASVTAPVSLPQRIMEYVRLGAALVAWVMDSPGDLPLEWHINLDPNSSSYAADALEDTLWWVDFAALAMDAGFVAFSGVASRRAGITGVVAAAAVGGVQIALESALLGIGGSSAEEYVEGITGALPNVFGFCRVQQVLVATQHMSLVVILALDMVAVATPVVLGIVGAVKGDDDQDSNGSSTVQKAAVTPSDKVAPNGLLLWYRNAGVNNPDDNAWVEDCSTVIDLNSWNTHRSVFGGYNGVFYSIGNDGNLRWHQYTSPNVPNYANWNSGSGVVIGSGGWSVYKQVFGGHNGVLYAIAPNGNLVWYKYKATDYASLTEWENGSGNSIGIGGWTAFNHVFGGHNGVFYAVAPNGNLVWYKYLSPNIPDRAAWAPNSGKSIGIGGWNTFKQVFGGVNGVIYAITHQGDLLWYRYISPDVFQPDNCWAAGTGTVIGHGGWQTFKQVIGGEEGIMYPITN